MSCSSSTYRPYQHVEQREQSVRDLTAGMGAVGVELLPGEAGEGPDGLLRQRGAHVLQKGEQRALILRRERLAAEQRQSVDIVRREQLAFRFGGKGCAVAKVPGLGLKAVFAAIGAAGDEKRHANTLAVGNVAVFDFSVVHEISPEKKHKGGSPCAKR